MQARRDRERRQRTVKYIAICLLAQQAAFQDAFGHLLDEQRHTVGAVYDLLDNFIGQRLASGDLQYQSRPVTPVQAIEREAADPRLAGPRRVKLGAEGHDQQYWQASYPLDGEVE